MIKIYSSKVLLALCLFLSISYSSSLLAQYEQKLTIHGSGAFVIPNIINLNDEINDENAPSFDTGFGFDGGLQYNTNRYFSWMGNARTFFNYATDNDGGYYNLAFGGGFKINLAGRKKINPYLFGEVNLNFVWLEYYYYYPESQTVYFEPEDYITLGGIAGIGFDYRFNDNFGMFIQSSAYYIHYDTYLNLYNQVGIRISLVKARTI